MSRIIMIVTAVAALAIAPDFSHAQHSHHGGMPAQADTAKAHAMKSPCPLHMSGLNTTPAQDSALARVRELHMAEMKQMRTAHGADSSTAHAADPAMKEHMKASMARAMDGMRAVLNEGQRQQLTAAVAAHEAEKAEMAKHGMPHDCGACCRAHHSKGEGAARHEH